MAPTFIPPSLAPRLIWPALTSLSLRGCGLTPSALRLLLPALPTLSRIDLGDNPRLGDEGAKLIAARILSLYAPPPPKRQQEQEQHQILDAAAVTPSLSSSSPSSSSTSSSSNSVVQEKDAIHLDYLALDDCRLTSVGVTALARALSVARSVWPPRCAHGVDQRERERMARAAKVKQLPRVAQITPSSQQQQHTGSHSKQASSATVAATAATAGGSRSSGSVNIDGGAAQCAPGCARIITAVEYPYVRHINIDGNRLGAAGNSGTGDSADLLDESMTSLDASMSADMNHDYENDEYDNNHGAGGVSERGVSAERADKAAWELVQALHANASITALECVGCGIRGPAAAQLALAVQRNAAAEARASEPWAATSLLLACVRACMPKKTASASTSADTSTSVDSGGGGSGGADENVQADVVQAMQRSRGLLPLLSTISQLAGVTDMSVTKGYAMSRGDRQRALGAAWTRLRTAKADLTAAEQDLTTATTTAAARGEAGGEAAAAAAAEGLVSGARAAVLAAESALSTLQGRLADEDAERGFHEGKTEGGALARRKDRFGSFLELQDKNSDVFNGTEAPLVERALSLATGGGGVLGSGASGSRSDSYSGSSTGGGGGGGGGGGELLLSTSSSEAMSKRTLAFMSSTLCATLASKPHPPQPSLPSSSSSASPVSISSNILGPNLGPNLGDSSHRWELFVPALEALVTLPVPPHMLEHTAPSSSASSLASSSASSLASATATSSKTQREGEDALAGAAGQQHASTKTKGTDSSSSSSSSSGGNGSGSGSGSGVGAGRGKAGVRGPVLSQKERIARYLEALEHPVDVAYAVRQQQRSMPSSISSSAAATLNTRKNLPVVPAALGSSATPCASAAAAAVSRSGSSSMSSRYSSAQRDRDRNPDSPGSSNVDEEVDNDVGVYSDGDGAVASVHVPVTETGKALQADPNWRWARGIVNSRRKPGDTEEAAQGQGLGQGQARCRSGQEVGKLQQIPTMTTSTSATSAASVPAAMHTSSSSSSSAVPPRVTASSYAPPPRSTSHQSQQPSRQSPQGPCPVRRASGSHGGDGTNSTSTVSSHITAGLSHPVRRSSLTNSSNDTATFSSSSISSSSSSSSSMSTSYHPPRLARGLPSTSAPTTSSTSVVASPALGQPWRPVLPSSSSPGLVLSAVSIAGGRAEQAGSSSSSSSSSSSKTSKRATGSSGPTMKRPPH